MSKTKYPVRKFAICGLARTGKDTVADYLESKYHFEKFAFASDMKRIFHELFPNVPPIPKPRRAYQVFGEGIRKLELVGAESVWIDGCLRKVVAYIWWQAEVDERGANVVITDLRLPAEYERLKDEGFTIIRVNAPEDVRLDRARILSDVFNEKDLAHETESYVDAFEVDYELNNDGSLDELFAKVDDLMAELKTADVRRQSQQARLG